MFNNRISFLEDFIDAFNFIHRNSLLDEEQFSFFFFFLSLQNFNFSQGLYNRLNLEYKHRTFLTTKYKNDFSRWRLFFLSVKIIAKIRVWLSSIYRSDCLDVSYAFLSRRSSYDPEFVFFFFLHAIVSQRSLGRIAVDQKKQVTFAQKKKKKSETSCDLLNA